MPTACPTQAFSNYFLPHSSTATSCSSSPGSADAARRKELSSQLRALPMSKDTMEEVIKAKAEWCAANPAAAASSPVCAVKKASSAGLKTEPRV